MPKNGKIFGRTSTYARSCAVCQQSRNKPGATRSITGNDPKSIDQITHRLCYTS